MDPTIFAVFIMTTLVVVLSPGPAAIMVASQGSGSGFLHAYFGIFGVAMANVVFFALSATGIASLILASHAVFTIVKWVGIVYLVYLGGSALAGRSGGLQIRKESPQPRRTLFLKGFVVEFANPKALLYFAAILPQFLDISRPIATQILLMGSATLFIDIAIYSVYAYLGHAITKHGMKSWVVNTINGVAGSALWLAAFKMARTV